CRGGGDGGTSRKRRRNPRSRPRQWDGLHHHDRCLTIPSQCRTGRDRLLGIVTRTHTYPVSLVREHMDHDSVPLDLPGPTSHKIADVREAYAKITRHGLDVMGEKIAHDAPYRSN